MSTLALVKNLQGSLLKEKGATPESTERLQDILQRLEECAMTMSILKDTMIGKDVNKLKNHATLGPSAKALIKKWKDVANHSDQEASSNASKHKDTIERRESLSSSTNNPESEWAGLPSMRQNICKKLYDILLASKADLVTAGINAEAVDHLLAPRAAEVEVAIYKQFSDKTAYADKARSLGFNFKKNAQLCQDVILGHIEADQLVTMSPEELASAEDNKAREEQAKKLIESKRLDWEQANEAKINEMCGIKGDLLKASLFTCGRCKSTKTTSTQKQTRSADEPMTVFVLCLNCGKRWKC